MHKLTKDQKIFSMDAKNEPVLRLESGETIFFETKDCFSDSIESEEDLILDIDFNEVNPATGPVYIQGAKLGDVLKVHIEKIGVSKQGVVTVAKGFGVLGDMVEEPSTRVVKVEGDKAYYLGVEIPMRKMIGVIGTAPADEPVATGIPGDHGGNMDCGIINEGSIVYLPVNVEGGLLAIGDLHAAMGDGEIGISAAEICGDVTVRVEVIKDDKLHLPMVETKEVIATIATADTMDEASYKATLNMVNYLVDNTKLNFNDAIGLVTLVGNLRPNQIVARASMRMEMDKKLIEQYK